MAFEAQEAPARRKRNDAEELLDTRRVVGGTAEFLIGFCTLILYVTEPPALS